MGGFDEGWFTSPPCAEHMKQHLTTYCCSSLLSRKAAIWSILLNKYFKQSKVFQKFTNLLFSPIWDVSLSHLSSFVLVKHVGHKGSKFSLLPLTMTESHKQLWKTNTTNHRLISVYTTLSNVFWLAPAPCLSPFSVPDSVVKCAGSSVCRTVFALAFRWTEGEAFDEATGEASRFLATNGGAGSCGRVVAQVGDVFVGLTEARVLLPVSPAEQELCATPEEAHCDTISQKKSIVICILYICR